MRHTLLAIILLTVSFINSAFGQGSIDGKSLVGKWKIDIMRDSADNAIDIASTSDSDKSDIIPYLTFKRKKIIMQYGKSKWKGEWHIKDNRLVINTTDKSSLSYPLVTLTGNDLTLEHTLVMSNDEKMIIRIFYKKIQ
jgi:hypothetical protein